HLLYLPLSCVLFSVFYLTLPPPPISTLFPYTTLFRSEHVHAERRFQRGMLEEIVEDDFRVAVALELDDHARVLIRLIATATRKRSEEHTSELQSRRDLVCRLLLEKKKQNKQNNTKNEQ